ncbi:hypothetical protein [Bordetella pertussis]|uniref:hypothetical protein n=1 Tax=Bordetella pertussis TaxID=520 RepID=UPI0003D3D3A2|nr:hypothetical protein [Bordetella pertussis]ETH74558.1 hypothetical protein L555_3778 [Bordetella pertussis STO1-CHOC-0008]
MHGSSEPDLRNWRCTHLQTQPGRIQPIDSSQLGHDANPRVRPENARHTVAARRLLIIGELTAVRKLIT